MITASALLFTALMTIAVAFQIAMALGAPWGEWANGGRWHGTLPKPMRVVAVVQGFFLATLGAVVLAHAGLINWAVPAWAIWGVTGVMALSAVMNIITPSIKERLLWGPIGTLACLSVAIVGFLV